MKTKIENPHLLSSIGLAIKNPDGSYDCYSKEFIVRTVNAHAKLIMMLKKSAELLDQLVNSDFNVDDYKEAENILQSLNDIIAKEATEFQA